MTTVSIDEEQKMLITGRCDFNLPCTINTGIKSLIQPIKVNQSQSIDIGVCLRLNDAWFQPKHLTLKILFFLLELIHFES